MKHTILLADDSVTIQKVVELTFLDEDVKVVSVGNGSDALARLDEVRPDLILADVHMPGADGYEVCATAQRVAPGVPVMLLVGTFELFDAEKAADAGASGHLKKPFDSQELLRRVRELLAAGPSATRTPSASAAASPPLSTLAFEPPAWQPEPAAVAESAESPAATDEGESWSFEPVGDAEPESPSAPAPEPPAATEAWGSFATTRFEAPIVAAHAPDVLEVAAPIAMPAAEPPAPAPAVSAAASAVPLSDGDLERIARRVAELLSDRAVKDVAWEVVPDLAEVLLKARIRELEAAVE